MPSQSLIPALMAGRDRSHGSGSCPAVDIPFVLKVATSNTLTTRTSLKPKSCRAISSLFNVRSPDVSGGVARIARSTVAGSSALLDDSGSALLLGG
jgi:hypothetical protein